jgi:hypothetical protein
MASVQASAPNVAENKLGVSTVVKANERKEETEAERKAKDKKKLLLQLRTEEYAGNHIFPSTFVGDYKFIFNTFNNR